MWTLFTLASVLGTWTILWVLISFVRMEFVDYMVLFTTEHGRGVFLFLSTLFGVIYFAIIQEQHRRRKL